MCTRFPFWPQFDDAVEIGRRFFSVREYNKTGVTKNKNAKPKMEIFKLILLSKGLCLTAIANRTTNVTDDFFVLVAGFIGISGDTFDCERDRMSVVCFSNGTT